jgi:hypothetical protein
MNLDLERVAANVRSATTEDLLDRATVYRDGMEPEALTVIEKELRRRGVKEDEIEAHAARRKVVSGWGGLARKCRRCARPASTLAWGWHWLWGLVPVVPWRYAYCDEHRPGAGRRGLDRQ